jgi:tRNA(fMet)-specific endonuclease VapC
VELGAARLILDTNALSATADNQRDAVKVISSAGYLAVPVIAIGEYRHGVAQSRNADRYLQWLDAFLGASEILDITDETSRHYAVIQLELKQNGQPIPTNDLWIAALCRQHRLPLLSRDRHFDVVRDLRRVDW